MLVGVGALFAFQALAIIGAPAAFAAVSCNYALATQTLSVALDAGGDVGTVSVDADGNILVNGLPCGVADVTNTTQITVQGAAGVQTLVIDNNGAGGSFPATIGWIVNLGAGDDEIEIDLEDDVDGTVVLTDSGFTMNGATGVIAGVEAFDIDGGTGNDTIDGSALTATGPTVGITGGAGDDTITGGAGDDAVLSGEGGADTVYGGAGDDTVNGNTGDDTVGGDAGDDTVNGGDGDDFVDEGSGQNGDDALTGGAGTDHLHYGDRTTATIVNVGGTSGEDANADGDLDDTEDENDTNAGFELIMTGSGNDILAGAAGAQTYFPGLGDDDIDGGGGVDTLSYADQAGPVTVDPVNETVDGAGADTFAAIESFEATGAANDEVTFADDTAGVEVNLSGDDSNCPAPVAPAVGSIDAETAGGFGVSAFENVTGGSGDDEIVGSSVRNLLSGGDGDDSLCGVGGNDALEGGAGNDNLEGGTGIDDASYRNAANGVDVNLSLGFASGDGDDTLSGVEGVIGSAFTDDIVGDGNSNLLKSGGGKDTVRAGGGDDTVRGGAANDILIGGSGDDSLYGGGGNDRLFGGSGTDLGNGGKGKDRCKGIEIRRSC